MLNVYLVYKLIVVEAGRPRKLCSVRKRSVSNDVLTARKRSGSDKSAQPERKSITRFGEEPGYIKTVRY
ncbi:hypothetical protein ACPCXF_17885 [Lysinibacillus agricola]